MSDKKKISKTKGLRKFFNLKSLKKKALIGTLFTAVAGVGVAGGGHVYYTNTESSTMLTLEKPSDIKTYTKIKSESLNRLPNGNTYNPDTISEDKEILSSKTVIETSEHKFINETNVFIGKTQKDVDKLNRLLFAEAGAKYRITSVGASSIETLNIISVKRILPEDLFAIEAEKNSIPNGEDTENATISEPTSTKSDTKPTKTIADLEKELEELQRSQKIKDIQAQINKLKNATPPPAIAPKR